MKDAKISLRTDSDLKRQAEDYAKETGRSLAGLIEYLLRQELKKAGSLKRGGQIGGNTMENVYKIDAADVYDIVREKYDESDIVSAAMAGFFPGFKSGYAVLDVEKHTIFTRSLGAGEYVPNDKDIVLYAIDQNILGDACFADEDWLTEEEIADMKTKDVSVFEYIEKYTDDTVESRLQEILEFYFDWDEVYGSISYQV